jgi:hypothetical protein
MNSTDRKEATAVVNTVLDAVNAVAKDAVGEQAAELRLKIGSLRVYAEQYINDGSIATPLAEMFDSARLAGVSYDGMDYVRGVAEAIATIGFPATSVKNTSARLALVQIGNILASVEYTSRQQVDDYIDRINDAFDTAETVAADSMDNAVYRALVSLHAAIAFDLNTRSLPLPRMVDFTAPSVEPMLWIANRLYGDASREEELRAENNPVHPAFVKPKIRCLSQ